MSRRRMTFKHAQERVSDMQTLTSMTVDRRALHRVPELGDELPKTIGGKIKRAEIRKADEQ